MPMARIAVMGPAGTEFVYKSEIGEIRAAYATALKAGESETTARRARDRKALPPPVPGPWSPVPAVTALTVEHQDVQFSV